MFDADGQSGRDLRQYLSGVAERCTAACDGDVGGGGGGGGDEVPSVIVVDGLHRVTSLPLADVFVALLSVQLCRRSLPHVHTAHP